LTGLDWVDVRLANDPDRSGVRFDLLVSDRSGKNAILRSNATTIQGWPGTSGLDRVHARTLRGSLASVRTKVDLSRIAAITLVARVATGRVWVLDVAVSQARIQVPAVLNLPVISVETVSVSEDSEPPQYNLKITSDKPLQSPGSIWVEYSKGDGFQVDIVPRSGTLVSQIPFSLVDDEVYSVRGSLPVFASIEAVRGVVTGNYIGVLTVVDNEPLPIISALSSNVTAIEGRSLQWTLNLSSPTDGTTISFIMIPPSSGIELTTNDVAPSWLASINIFSRPTIPVPLSSLGLRSIIEVSFDYGVTLASLVIPLSRDGQSEGNESILLQLVSSFDFNAPVQPLTLIGNVVAHV
jgi:hypothetical protein